MVILIKTLKNEANKVVVQLFMLIMPKDKKLIVAVKPRLNSMRISKEF
jgi:hypothetical protein